MACPGGYHRLLARRGQRHDFPRAYPDKQLASLDFVRAGVRRKVKRMYLTAHRGCTAGSPPLAGMELLVLFQLVIQEHPPEKGGQQAGEQASSR